METPRDRASLFRRPDRLRQPHHPGPGDALGRGNGATDDDMPRLDELLASVADFLREDVMDETQGRTRFLARVAANSVDIVLRDRALGETMRRRELLRLRAMLETDGDLAELRWRLVRRLREESVPLDHDGLIEHLRQTVADEGWRSINRRTPAWLPRTTRRGDPCGRPSYCNARCRFSDTGEGAPCGRVSLAPTDPLARSFH